MITAEIPVSTVTVLVVAAAMAAGCALAVIAGALLGLLCGRVGGAWGEATHEQAAQRLGWGLDLLRAAALLGATALVAGVIA